MAEVLLIDLGGTNCRLGLSENHRLVPETVRTFRNDTFKTFDALLTAYLDTQGTHTLSAVCSAVAGPVQNKTAQLTNHNWKIESDAVCALTKAEFVYLMNDVQAQAYALADLPDDQVTPLIEGHSNPGKPAMVLCLGTGCNIATAHMLGDHVFVPASESGHTTLPDAPEHRELYTALRSIHAHLPIEAALSASGLSRIHAHLSGEAKTSHQIIESQDDRTLECYLSILGLVAGNLCLANMATGGLYLIGGLARAVAPFVNQPVFHENFIARGPYSDILAKIPVWVVDDDAAALTGCARYLRQNPAV